MSASRPSPSSLPPGLLLLTVLLLGGGAAARPRSARGASEARAPAPEWLARLPKGERWQEHLRQELLPFWTMPSALGEPLGAFPSVRCNDGSLLDRSNPCPELRGNDWLLADVTYVVALSRQTYAYGVAFHLTGEPRYLALARAGVDHLRQHAFDREHGGAFSWRDNAAGAWGPDVSQRNPQEQSYALLGLAFYYYLTRDEAVLQDLVAGKEYLFQAYGPPPLRQSPGGQGPVRVMDTLDPLNTFLVLLTPTLPPRQRKAWERDMQALSRQLVDGFYSPSENLFFRDLLPPEERKVGNSEADFGHTIKALWMLRMVGQLTKEPKLVRFAETHGPQVLRRAFDSDTGAWTSRPLPDGSLDKTRDWFIHAELDQFAASLALTTPSAGQYLPATVDFWMRRFVDPAHGEVWTFLDGATHQPLPVLPKQWPWKNGYHSFEHALVGYITARQLHGEPVVLHYAFQPAESAPRAVRPYFYSGEVQHVQPVAPSVYRVTFRAVR
ncbi:AGE family epimerase/isomerase [Myxococcus sp. K15C18031901]|uniref:AGE family epimerase/isomerase n=1 Tax=Myxococcus dinghuensis TaxID=2906761 RepID=UPI0020A74CE3|nr:AGE family epimerase/isomerase [Myxococcus dinghuensis]MCP3100469.1 AGE family epimerase/isomerase [Myxococcus dinghuensis]